MIASKPTSEMTTMTVNLISFFDIKNWFAKQVQLHFNSQFNPFSSSDPGILTSRVMHIREKV